MLHSAESVRTRALHVDLLRGFVMVVMALDHTRDYFHDLVQVMDPLNPAQTSLPLYVTRWITHLCAPTFVFLSGVSIWLQHLRKPTGDLARFLAIRGIWLVAIELAYMSLVIFMDIHYDVLLLQVIYAIGMSMICMALLIWLPPAVCLGIGLAIVFGHNLLDYYERSVNNQYGLLYSLTFGFNIIKIGKTTSLFVAYPFVPWLGIMLCGYGTGKWFSRMGEAAMRKKFLVTAVCMLLLFFVLRYINAYGDPFAWTEQKENWRTALSFFNVNKYPPSLVYVLATLGVSFALIALIANPASKIFKPLLVFGRVPMFYYVLHFLLLAILHLADWFRRGHTISEGMVPNNNLAPKFMITGEGFSLAGVYVIWIMLVLILYPLCRWFANYKKQHPEKKWLSFF